MNIHKLFILFIFLQSFATAAQEFNNNKRHHWGLELSLYYDDMGEYYNPEASITVIYEVGIPDFRGALFSPSVGFGLGGVYQFNPKKWLGFQTGLGFRGVFAFRNIGNTGGGYRNIYLTRIPLSIQLRPFNWFALEGGFSANIYLSHIDGYESDDLIRANDFKTASLEWNAGMRFWLVENLSLGLGINDNITPLALSPIGYELDLFSLQLNLRYMFPFK